MAKKKKNYKKLAAFWVAVFLVGGVAGLFFGQVVAPWLASYWPFNKIAWLCHTKEGTTIINKTEKVYLTQDLAYLDSIGRLVNAAALIRSERGSSVLIRGTGFVLASDGYLVTTSTNVPRNATRFVVVRDGREKEAQVIKRDDQNNLALLKIDENNLPVVGLGDANGLKLGQMVFLLGAQVQDAKIFNPLAQIGFIRTLSPQLTLNFTELQMSGAPLATVNGEVMGLVLAGRDGDIEVITSDKIRQLLK